VRVPSDWERVAGDPALLAALRRRYAGSGDAMDRLWWLEHPGEPTPEGSEDPAAALDRARRELYRPGAAPQDAGRLQAAEAAIAEDRDAVVRALRSLDADPPARQRTGSPGAARRRSRGVVAGAVATALVLGAATGFAIGRFVHPDAPALQVFHRSQREADRPPSATHLPASIRRSSLREVGSASSSGTVLYGARATDGRVCLIAVVLVADTLVTCSTDTAFADGGLSLGFQALVDPVDDSNVIRMQQITVVWRPDGAIRF
jgi:hypothetical protein